jgi:4-hydroxybutyrate dehydrogenase
MPSIFTFPTRIRFGEGERASLVPELERLGVSRPLVVTDPGITRLDMARDLIESLPGRVVFADVHANPTEGDVLAALDVYRREACDGIVGLGGGSPLDAAKAARLLVTHPGKLADYDFTSGGMDRITPDLPPMVAIPTTSGTGSEAGRGALIQVPETGRKLAAISPHLLPSVSICDPDLTLSMPPALTAGTGMDALSHCIESFLSTTYHPICDGIALEGLKHIARGLEAAVRDGANRLARREMMMGSLLGGISFHKGLGVIHSLSHALGADGRAHHGTLNAILLPHALRFNLPAAEAGLAELATYMGVGRGLHGPGHLITLTELVLARLPLPQRLGAVPGLERSRIPEYARLAILDHCHRTNPRPCSVQDMEDLLERAW